MYEGGAYFVSTTALMSVIWRSFCDRPRGNKVRYPSTPRATYLGRRLAEEGIKMAAELIDSGKAYETLKKIIEVSNRPEEE